MGNGAGSVRQLDLSDRQRDGEGAMSGGLSTGTVTVAVSVSVPWAGEGRMVTVSATCALRGPEERACPIRGVPIPAPGENNGISRQGGER